jgi:quercetin dioxygenase-like cupin family protein
VEELYYTYKSLSPTFPDKRMQPFYIEVELVSLEDVKPAIHPGEEFLFVLEGTVQWKGEDESHTLNKGDAIHFDSGIPHRIVGVGDAKPRVIAVVYQPTN